MSEQASLETEVTTTAEPRWWWWLVGGLALVLLVWLVLTLRSSRPLKMWPDTAVPPNATLNPQARLVDFDALNDNPSDYVNQRIRVSGSYLRLEPVDCAQFNGPRIQWGLVAEGLQLNAKGFEAIVVPIVPPDTAMTVDGIWRRYPGPAGCGKEPERGLWYLEVEQIVQPNPLMAGSSTPAAVLSITPPPFPTVTPTGTATQTPIGSTATLDITATSTVVITPSSTPTLPGTAVLGTPTATETSSATATTTAGPGTPTGASGTPTVIGTPTPGGTPGTAVPTPTGPPLGTATSGYPGPPTVPSPTAYP